MVPLNLADIQGNILRGYNFPAAVYSFISLGDGERGRGLLRKLLPDIVDATEWVAPPAIATNVAVTYAGLQALEVADEVLVALPGAFQEPIRERAALYLGDTGRSDPDDWEKPFGRGVIHLLVMLAASAGNEGPPLARAVQRLDRLVKRAGARCVHRQEVQVRQDQSVLREHFGYADGFGQPAIEGMSRTLPGQGAPEHDSRAWRDIKAGEFVLGYPDEEGEVVSGPATWLLANGSYMVYRKLQQDVPLFEQIVSRQARHYNLVAGARLSQQAAFELLAAKLVGRWRDGVALELDDSWGRGATVHADGSRDIQNDFRYGNDEPGFRCPRGAHIRRANPRDLHDAVSTRHRIIRRGMPYGLPYPTDPAARAADDGDRGLIFICFNADIERQFEVVQGQWCADGTTLGLGGDQDFLLGCRDGKVTIDGEPPFLVARRPDLVITRGCEYLLMPGLDALERLAAPHPGLTHHEVIPAGEPGAAATVVQLVGQEMRTAYSRSRPAGRGQHPKSHGLVRARFIVDDDVPQELRWGLFAEAGKYDAWIRFSGSHAPAQSDARTDAHGMSIKVMGVMGEKVLPSERWATTQDFVLVNHDVFFCRDVVEYAAFAEAMTASTAPRDSLLPVELRVVRFYLPPLNPFRWQLREFRNLLAVIGQRISNPLDVQYWSQTPYALGPHAVKYSARPLPREGGTEALAPRGYDDLLHAVAESLTPGGPDYAFELLVQRQTDPSRMPVEDPTVRWSALFQRVATIQIAGQDILSQTHRNLGERMAFTPWHALCEHRPLGGINRVRRSVYLASSELRRNLNDAVEREPGGLVPKDRRT